jgi:DNA-binding NtrC family response regulator
MANRIAYLLSSDAEFRETVAACSNTLPHLEIVTRPTVEGIRHHLPNEEAALLLAHLDTNSTQAESELARFVTDTSRSLHTVVFSDHYDDRQAVRFLRAGAASYLGLPIEPHRLNFLLDALTFRARCHSPKPAEPAAHCGGQDISYLALDPEVGVLRDQIRRVVAQDTTILLTGETGTGKTRLARLIHELSPRCHLPFLVVDCGALTANLIESEMFGHVKGAFTGADRDRVGKFSAVGGGTLLMDEVNSLPASLQCKLLRAVDDRVFEPVGSNKLIPLQARLIVATNVALDQEVADGRFRADLYYRLNVLGFRLPPLRERRTVIPALINRFLADFAHRHDLDMIRIHPDAMRLLREYHWPGNLRELHNVIERAASLCASDEIQVSDLPDAVQTLHRMVPSAQRRILSSTFGVDPTGQNGFMASWEEAEMVRIMEVLERNGNNRLRTAAELGISRMSLYKKLHKYGLMKAS